MGTAGARFVEQDQSTSPQQQVTSKKLFAITCRKGTIGKPIEVRSYDQFLSKCGQPYPGSDDALVVKEAVDRGVVAVISRIVHATDPDDISTILASKASYTLLDRTTSAGAAVQQSNVGPFNLAAGDDLIINLSGSTAPTITLAASHATLASPAIASTSGIDLSGGKVLNVRLGRNADLGPVQYVTFSNADFVDPANATPEEMRDAINDRLSGGHATVTGPAGARILSIVDDIAGSNSAVQVLGGTANAEIGFGTTLTAATGTQNVANASASTATELAALITGAGISGLTATATEDGRLRVASTATGASAYIEFTAPSVMATKVGYTAGAGGRATGTNTSSATNTVIARAKSEGVWGAGIQFQIVDNVDIPGTFNVFIPAQTGVDVSENHVALSMDPASTNYAVPHLTSNSRVLEFADAGSTKSGSARNPQAGTYTLSGGNDGLIGLTPDDYVGGSRSGLGVYAFDPVQDAMDLFVPSLTDRVAIQQIGQYCESRRDLVFYPTFPHPQDPDDCVDFTNAAGVYAGQGTKFNSSYMAFYFDQPIEKDLSNVQRAVPGMGHIAAVLAYNDTGIGGGQERLVTGVGPWFAPAGSKRAKVLSLGVAYNAAGKPEIKQQLEDAQINLFADFGDGPLLWDQRTMLRGTSALRDLNVRRLLIMLKRDTVALVRQDVWDPNDPMMWRAVHRRLDPYMQRLKVRRAFYDYRINCDQTASTIEEATVNDPISIDEGKFKCLIFMKPTRAAREITLVGILTRSDAKFDEIVP